MLRNPALLLLAVVASPLVASAQVPTPTEGPARPEAAAAPAGAPAAFPWRVSVATGAGTIVEVVDAFASDFGNGLVGVEERRSSRTEVIVRVDRERGPLRLGASYAFTTWDQGLYSGATRIGSSTDQVHALMLHALVDWIREDQLELYSGLGVGVSLWHASMEVNGDRQADDSAFLAFQLHALGLGVGTPRFRAFAELGLGYQGFLVAGLSGRF